MASTSIPSSALKKPAASAASSQDRKARAAGKPRRVKKSFRAAAIARSAKRILVAAEASGARIVGITSDRRGAGVSSIVREVATAYGRLGKKTLIFDLGRLGSANEDTGERVQSIVKLLSLNLTESPNVSLVEVSPDGPHPAPEAAIYKEAFEGAGREFDTIVVDLPPVIESGDEPSSTAMAAGAVCDLVLLVCVTGATSRSELTTCLETCRICGVKIGGLVLNDWRLPFERLLAGL